MRQEICERLDDLPEVMVAIIHAQLSLLAQPSEQTAGGRKVDGGVNKPLQLSQRMYWEHFRCRILTGQEAYLAEMGKLFQMEVPTGHRGVAEGEPFPGLAWIHGWGVIDWISVSG